MQQGAKSSAADLEVRKFIQLVLLLHARQCLSHTQSNGEVGQIGR